MLTPSSSPRIQKLKENGFTPSKHSGVCAELFTEDSFEQNVTVWSLSGLSFKPRRLAFKKDAGPTICNFSERCKPAIGQTNDEKQASNALRTTGELFSHFPSEKRFVFRSKTFSTNDSPTMDTLTHYNASTMDTITHYDTPTMDTLRQKRSNV